MIPYRDHNPSRRMPVVTVVLIALNTLVWLYEVLLMGSGELDTFIYAWAIIPRNLVTAPGLASLITVFTAMFMHGSWMHLIGNMLYLWIFGDNIEDALGKPLFILFYLASGVAATVAQVAIDPFSTVPNLGASGAIAGVLGAYLVLYPRAQVDTLVPVGLGFMRVITIPALYVLGFWFVLQFFSGVGTLGVQTGGGVAYFAHIGGFVAGAALVGIARLLGGFHSLTG